jgi:hypothetical protein
VTLTFDKVVKRKADLFLGLKYCQCWVMLGLQLWKLRNVIRLMSAISIKFLVIEVKLMQGLMEKHIVMRLPASLMSLKLFQLEKQGRKISTKMERRKFNPWRAFIC